MKVSTVIKAGALAALGLAAGAAWADPAVCELTTLQKAAGYVTMANTVKFIAAAFFAVFSGIFLLALAPMFSAVPKAVWKALGYAGVSALCAASMWADAASAPYIQFAGAALGAGALMILLSDLADAIGVAKKGTTAWQASVAVGAGLLALVQTNSMVAGISVAGFMGLLGFSAFSVPGMIGMGFNGKASLWRATIGALALLVPAVLWHASFGNLGPMEIFWPAIGWLGSLVAGVGLLIASSRYFTSPVPYLVRNVLMLVFGLFCIWAGSVHSMVEAQRVGGTLLVVWLFEKPWDIPSRGLLGYSLLGAASCAGLFLLMREVAAHPERWSSFLLF